MDEHEQPITAENTMFKELENLHFYVDDESEVSNEDGEMCSAYLVHEDGTGAFVVDEEDECHTSVDEEDECHTGAFVVDDAFVFVEEDESDFLSTEEGGGGGVLLVDEGEEETFFVDERRCNVDDIDASSDVNCDELNEDHNSEHAIRIDGDEDIIGIDLESFSPHDICKYDFASLDVAYGFYERYAKANGFSIRRGRMLRSKKTGETLGQDFVCCRQGD